MATTQPSVASGWAPTSDRSEGYRSAPACALKVTAVKAISVVRSGDEGGHSLQLSQGKRAGAASLGYVYAGNHAGDAGSADGLDGAALPT